MEEILVEQLDMITTFADSERQLQAPLARQLSTKLSDGQGNAGTQWNQNGTQRQLLQGQRSLKDRASGPVSPFESRKGTAVHTKYELGTWQ